MSRLSKLAALLHLHADHAATNPHPINLAQSVGEGFRAIAGELQSLHDEVGAALEHVAAMGTEELHAIVGAFQAGTAGAFDGAPQSAAAEAQPVAEADPADERAQRMYEAFAAALVDHFPADPWTMLPGFLQDAWRAVAGVQ